MNNTKFNNWIDTFIEEKELDLNTNFEYEGKQCLNIIDLQTIVNTIKETDGFSKLQIKDKIIFIDFKNGNVLDFFKYLGNSLVV